jgi:uncharacterized surface protein with fasciclin (FAS1) repeats
MKRMTKSLLLLIVLLLMLVPAVFAQEEAPTMPIPANSIAGVAVADGRFDTLVAAASAAGLVDDLSGGTWTVFAPTDDAFAKLGLNADNIADEFSPAELQDILLYHVLSGSNSTANLKAMLGDVTMANGQIAGLKYYKGAIYVNDDAKVIIPNILTDNGYIQVVDTVILGPWPRDAQPVAAEDMDVMEEDAVMEEEIAVVEDMDMEEEMVTAEPEAPAPSVPANSIAGIAVNDGRFDTLVAAASAAGLVDALSGGTWTVFAPTDEAFAKLGLNADNIADNFTVSELQDVLLYHVIPSGMYSTAQLKTMLGNVTMANDQWAGLSFYKDNIYVNDMAKVIIPNIVADNGYIHVVDNVILGPWPKE